MDWGKDVMLRWTRWIAWRQYFQNPPSRRLRRDEKGANQGNWTIRRHSPAELPSSLFRRAMPDMMPDRQMGQEPEPFRIPIPNREGNRARAKRGFSHASVVAPSFRRRTGLCRTRYRTRRSPRPQRGTVYHRANPRHQVGNDYKGFQFRAGRGNAENSGPAGRKAEPKLARLAFVQALFPLSPRSTIRQSEIGNRHFPLPPVQISPPTLPSSFILHTFILLPSPRRARHPVRHSLDDDGSVRAGSEDRRLPFSSGLPQCRHEDRMTAPSEPAPAGCLFCLPAGANPPILGLTIPVKPRVGSNPNTAQIGGLLVFRGCV